LLRSLPTSFKRMGNTELLKDKKENLGTPSQSKARATLAQLRGQARVRLSGFGAESPKVFIF